MSAPIKFENLPPHLRADRLKVIRLYNEVLIDDDIEAQRELCRKDLFYLLTVAMKRVDANHDWLYDRCREVQAEPNGMLDLWSRAHYKSTIITFALSIQDILNDPEITIGIFSHTATIAGDFLNQIKSELEDNQYLKDLFPEILYQNPQREAPKWGLEKGIQVKRTGNPKEATVEAWALGQGTGRHFDVRVYDDVVTEFSVTTPEMIEKTTDSWRLSMNLGRTIDPIVRYIGTRYHFNDTYREIIATGAAKPRIYVATEDGDAGSRADGVLLSSDALAEKRKIMGPYIYACQMYQNPVADSVMGFREDWLLYYRFPLKSLHAFNLYLLVDPAGSKKKSSDYTVMAVIGLGPDQKYYLVDAVRDRLNLTERGDLLFKLVRKYNPTSVGYEKYGLQADVEYMKKVMEEENYRFKIIELGGNMAKVDRIRRLVPTFENGEFFIPHRLLFLDNEGRQHDFVAEFKTDEFVAFPVAIHDDMLDCISRIHDPDLNANFPQGEGTDDRRGAAKKAKHQYNVLGR